MKKKLMLTVAGALCISLIGCSMASFAGETESDYDAIVSRGKLVVGITDFAPMDYKDDDGNWIGFDADLATAFAEMMGVEVEFQEIDWDNKILELNSGTVDCIWNGMTLTPEVDDSMECTVTYALNAQVVVMATDALADYADAESLADLTIAVEAGSAGESAGEDAGLEVNPVQSQAAALMEVAAGTSDACIIDKTMADAMTGEGTSYADLGYTLALSSEDYVVGFRKGSDCAEAANLFFAVMNETGALQELSEKYDNAVSIAEFDDEDMEAIENAAANAIVDGLEALLTAAESTEETEEAGAGESGGDAAAEAEAAQN